MRKLLHPILKLFFNPNPLIQALHIQSELNTRNAKREELDALHYEVLHNLVIELTRVGIEVKNLKMRVESMSSRLDFDERRARALEGVVQYRPGAAPPLQPPSSPGSAARPDAESDADRRTRRRRRRGRRRPGERDGRPEGHGGHQGTHQERPDENRERNAEPQQRPPGARTHRRGHVQRIVKLAVVVQRYGADINGGAELHARYIAERLSRHVQVEVVTTCAHDYVTWRNELPAGVSHVNGVQVRRFPVRHERVPRRIRPALAPSLRIPAFDRRRARMARE